MDKFVDPTDDIFPPAVPAWRGALESFDANKAVFTYEGSPIDVGYVFPEPMMFVRVQTTARKEAYFESWLRYRSAFIYRANAGTAATRPIPTQVWRDILTHDWGQTRTPSTTAAPSATTRSKGQWDQALRLFEECTQADGVEFLGLHNGCMTWGGRPVEKITDKIREEVLWELCKLNFRYELFALNSRVCRSKTGRELLIAACFPNCTAVSISVADLGNANHGLADEDWEQRAVYLQAFRRLMSTWVGVPDIMCQEKWQWTRAELDYLENTVTTFYVKSFFKHFRRAPVLPHRLSHTAAPYQKPQDFGIIVQDAAPNIFYDNFTIAKGQLSISADPV